MGAAFSAESHFRIPDGPDVYLDVLGVPPRVPAFEEAQAAAEVIPTAWGYLPTIGIRHLVDLKMTQRLGDYPIIGQLVMRYLETRTPPTSTDYDWTAAHLFALEDIQDLLVSYPIALSAIHADSPVRAFAEACCAGAEASDDVRKAAEAELTERMLRAREADRAYWGPIIQELRQMWRTGALMPNGAPVTA